MTLSFSQLRRPTLLIAASLLALLLLSTGCGRKGDLVRPGQQTSSLTSVTVSLPSPSANAEIVTS